MSERDDLSLLEEVVATTSSALSKLQKARSVRRSSQGVNACRLLWAHDIALERVSGEIVLIGDLDAASPLVRGVIDRYADDLIASYEHAERFRVGLDEIAITDVPAEWWDGVRPERVYPNTCSIRTAEWAATHHVEGMRLVAVIVAPEPESPDRFWTHAVLELPGDVVFDGVFQRFYPRDAWYAFVQPTIRATPRITPSAAARSLGELRRDILAWSQGCPTVHWPEFDALVEADDAQVA